MIGGRYVTRGSAALAINGIKRTIIIHYVIEDSSGFRPRELWDHSFESLQGHGCASTDMLRYPVYVRALRLADPFAHTIQRTCKGAAVA
jgi:hypothetical protein